MDVFFLDPNVERLPPEATRLLDLRAEPYPDGQRIRIGLDLTPFQKRPYLELSLTDPDGLTCSSASIVEPMGWKLELTLHNRSAYPTPITLTLTAILSYPDLGEIDRRQIPIDVSVPE